MGATTQRFGYQFGDRFNRLDFGVKFGWTDSCLGEIGATPNLQTRVFDVDCLRQIGCFKMRKKSQDNCLLLVKIISNFRK